MKPGYIYILTNTYNTTLYTGITSNIITRICEHRSNKFPLSFSARFDLRKLVYFEAFQEIGDAIGREKQIKAGSRAKKEALIKSIKPNLKDLYEKCLEEFGEF